MKIHNLEEKMTPLLYQNNWRNKRENGDQFREPTDHRKVRNNV
jgi:hypothetical protein